MNDSTLNHQNGLEVAVIGMSGRFPGAATIAEFWQNLRDGKESISFFTDEELEHSGVDATLRHDPQYVKAGGVVADIDRFDAAFFGIAPRDAEVLDPQHRLFLECAWSALENAGYDPQQYDGTIGVYGGARLGSYLLVNLFPNRHQLLKSVSQNQILLGNDPGNLTTRVSYKLNLEGPSCAVETACSTSLVAVHLACQSLLNGECDTALAGGVGISAQQKSGYRYQEGDILSPDGHCRAFDAQAQGTVGGNGVGIVVLKRLADAVADGDRICALIKGSAINNDGSLKVSYTAPRIDSQAKVIQTAQAIADVHPETITYIEAHGTGTTLGDPIEIAALTQAFHHQTQQTGFCAIGSVKTNVGHLGVAAGITGLIKTILALQHQQIPPSLHFQQPNPKIDFAHSPFYVNTQLSEWQTNGTPRRAGVSSFGMGGTNAHIILEEAPPTPASGTSRSHQLLLLSAKTSAALKTATTNLVHHLKQHPDLNLADVAYTLQVGRQTFAHRHMVVCQDLNEAVNALGTLDIQPSTPPQSNQRQIVFMFPGQGAQYGDMGRSLYKSEPIFREHVDLCCELLEPHLELDLRSVLYPPDSQLPTPDSLLTQTRYTQPALFVIEYALAQLWMSWGIKPQAMIGHSIGEYVAACLAGVFRLEDALRLVAIRGCLMQQLPTGAMLAVPLSEPDLQPLLSADLALAAHNAPNLCVVSGSVMAVDGLRDSLLQQGVECRLLHTSHAFHSPMMNPILEPFMAQVSQVSLQAPEIPFLSNVTGTWITTAEATNSGYWAQHLRQTVRFAEGIATLSQNPDQIFLEVGPGRTLSTLAKQSLAPQVMVLASLPHPRESQPDEALLLQTLGKLWLNGVSINWQAFSTYEQRQRLPLPTYPFERQRYWIDAIADSASGSIPSVESAAIAKQSNIADWFYLPVWKQTLPLEATQPKNERQSLVNWLVFVEETGIGTEIAAQLNQAGKTVITVTAGETFEKLSDDLYAINPQKRDDYQALIQALYTSGTVPDAIAHFWSLAPAATEPQRGFYSLLFLVQAIAQQNITQPLTITLFTRNAHSVTGDELLCPEQATAIGLCKVIPQEYPNITCRSVDLNSDISSRPQRIAQRLIDQWVAELTTEPTDLVVAYRGQHRWTQLFEAVHLDDRRSPRICLRKQGVYVITGGLGRLGLAIATYLARTVTAKLAFINRSELPERSRWANWLETHAESDSVSRKIQQVQAIEALGAEVLIIQADVSNNAQMQEAIAQIEHHFNTIHGVIHAAGISNKQAIQTLSFIDCQQQFQSKVEGLIVLETILRDKSLDFCVLCSSLASVLGGLGFAAYAAANAFMDAFAYQQRHRSPYISVNWDGWQFASETQRPGAVPANGTLKGATESTLAQLGINPDEGTQVFERILSLRNVTQIVVSTGNLQHRINQWLKLESLRQMPTQPQDSLTLSARTPLTSPDLTSRNELEQIVAGIWQQVLGIEQVGIDDNFFDLGGNSLSSISVVAQLKQALDIQIPIVSLYERPTVSSLAALLKRDQVDEETLLAPSLTRGQKRRETKKQRR